ncbi:hydrolase [Hoeflea sp. TYP-13]|uniref:hydrolase n=1 Tax=Hoeflea sp. TYP-13 TaxID=3230023 RepID=UPI0034C6D111
MQTNRLPEYDASDNPTGCCPRFNPLGWDDCNLHFKNKLFVKATTRSENHVPIDMGPVFEKTFAAIQAAGAYDENDFIVLSRDISPSKAEHFFAVSKPVPGQETVHWSGNYLTKVFEGPFEDAHRWESQTLNAIEARHHKAGNIYYFYTTCPKCAQTYGKNYVVAVAELDGSPARNN